MVRVRWIFALFLFDAVRFCASAIDKRPVIRRQVRKHTAETSVHITAVGDITHALAETLAADTQAPTTAPTTTTASNLVSIEFGGYSHRSQYDGQLFRPEQIHVEECVAGVCTGCTAERYCWRGKQAGNLVMAVPAKVDDKETLRTAEMWVTCGTNEAEWDYIYFSKNTNSHVYLQVDDGEKRTLQATEVATDPSYQTSSGPCTPAGAQLTKGTSDATTFRCKGGYCIPLKGRCNGFRNCGDNSDELDCTTEATEVSHRLEMPKDGKNHKLTVGHRVIDRMGSSYAVLKLRARGVKIWVDVCMSKKLCMKELGDRTSSSFNIRNSNLRQRNCLNGEPATDDQERCLAWTNCLREGEEQYMEALKNLLNAMAPRPSLTEMERRQSAAATENVDCMDPSVADPESLECECWQDIQAKCGEAEEQETCFQKHLCMQPEVSCTWKLQNCDEHSQQPCCKGTAGLMQNDLTRRGQANSSQIAKLDAALEGKCNI